MRKASKETNVVQNYIYNLLYQILTIITPFITAPYTARLFKAEGIGIESYVSSVTYYFSLFGALGIAVYGQREIARCRNSTDQLSRTFWELFILKLCSMGLTIIAYIIMVININENQVYFWISTMTLIASILDISWFLMGIENFKILVLRNTLVKIISIVILFTFIKSSDQLLLFMVLSTVTTTIANITMWPYALKSIKRVSFKTLNIRRHIKDTLIYFVPTIATSIYTVLDKVMIGILTDGTVENGYYEQANKMLNMAKTVLLSLNTVMLPRMSMLYVEGKFDQIKEKLSKSLEFVMVLGIPMTFGLIGISDNFVSWFFGDGFNGTVINLQIIAVLIVIIGISNCLESQYITPAGRKRESNRIVIIGAVINFSLNMVLIPRFGSVGASIASVAAEIIITIMYVRICKSLITTSFIWSITFKRLISGCIMLLVIWGVTYIPITAVALTILQIVAGVIVYLGCLMILKDNMCGIIIKQSVEKIKTRFGR